MPGAFEQTGGAHRALAVATHHHQRLTSYLISSVGERTEFDMLGAGEVAGVEFGVLPDIEDGVQVRVRGECHRQSTPLSGRGGGPQVDTDIHEQGPPVVQVDQVRRVAQAFVHQWYYGHCCSSLTASTEMLLTPYTLAALRACSERNS